jgi:hypothetical protein
MKCCKIPALTQIHSIISLPRYDSRQTLYMFLINLQLQRGANDARSDDVRRIKEEVANWINQTLSPTTPLSLKQRDDRGFQNDITGRLLCPIELSWDDDEYNIPINPDCNLMHPFVAFVARFELRNSIYPRTIFSLAFIPTDLEILTMWNMASFAVAF